MKVISVPRGSRSRGSRGSRGYGRNSPAEAPVKWTIGLELISGPLAGPFPKLIPEVHIKPWNLKANHNNFPQLRKIVDQGNHCVQWTKPITMDANADSDAQDWRVQIWYGTSRITVAKQVDLGATNYPGSDNYTNVKVCFEFASNPMCFVRAARTAATGPRDREVPERGGRGDKARLMSMRAGSICNAAH